MRFSLQGNILKPTISEEFRRAEAAEELGFEGLFFPSGLSISIDSFLLVAACAMRTKRIRLGLVQRLVSTKSQMVEPFSE